MASEMRVELISNPRDFRHFAVGSIGVMLTGWATKPRV